MNTRLKYLFETSEGAEWGCKIGLKAVQKFDRFDRVDLVVLCGSSDWCTKRGLQIYNKMGSGEVYVVVLPDGYLDLGLDDFVRYRDGQWGELPHARPNMRSIIQHYFYVVHDSHVREVGSVGLPRRTLERALDKHILPGLRRRSHYDRDQDIAFLKSSKLWGFNNQLLQKKLLGVDLGGGDRIMRGMPSVCLACDVVTLKGERVLVYTTYAPRLEGVTQYMEPHVLMVWEGGKKLFEPLHGRSMVFRDDDLTKLPAKSVVCWDTSGDYSVESFFHGCDQVDLRKVYDDLVVFFEKYLWFPLKGTIPVMAVWAIHTYFLRVLRVTPYLHIQSPRGDSGKSTAARLLSLVCFNAQAISNIHEDYLTDIPAHNFPTMIFSEGGKLNGSDSSRLQDVLRDGYKSMFTQRPKSSKGPEFNPIFCAKVVCSIFEIAPKTANRFIKIDAAPIPRKKVEEVMSATGMSKESEVVGQEIRNRLHVAMCQRFADVDELRKVIWTPGNHPEELAVNRMGELWLPLLIISSLIDGKPLKGEVSKLLLNEIKRRSKK